MIPSKYDISANVSTSFFILYPFLFTQLLGMLMAECTVLLLPFDVVSNLLINSLWGVYVSTRLTKNFFSDFIRATKEVPLAVDFGTPIAVELIWFLFGKSPMVLSQP